MTAKQQIETKQTEDSKTPVFYYLGIAFLVLFSGFWVLTNLDICLLWQDEGEIVCVAETVLTEGIPKGTDGKNFFLQQEGRKYGANYEWKLHPWFQFYWLAFFFSFFEHTTFIARFPFASLVIGTVLLSFFLALRIWKDKPTAFLVAGAFLLNVMFLRFGSAFFAYIFEPIWLLLLPLFFMRSSINKLKELNKESEQILLFFLLIIGSNIVAISLLVPEYYIPYLCVTIPFALLIKARIAGWLAYMHLAIPIVLFIAVAHYKGDVANCLKELKAKEAYLGPMEAMVNFLERETSTTDKIAISFGDLPENLDSIDVIIIRRTAIDQMDRKVQKRLYQYLKANEASFKSYALNVENTPFQNKEIPKDHYYETPLVTNALVVHKRRK